VGLGRYDYFEALGELANEVDKAPRGQRAPSSRMEEKRHCINGTDSIEVLSEEVKDLRMDLSFESRPITGDVQ
jgi:hypothetical protein